MDSVTTMAKKEMMSLEVDHFLDQLKLIFLELITLENMEGQIWLILATQMERL